MNTVSSFQRTLRVVPRRCGPNIIVFSKNLKKFPCHNYNAARPVHAPVEHALPAWNFVSDKNILKNNYIPNDHRHLTGLQKTISTSDALDASYKTGALQTCGQDIGSRSMGLLRWLNPHLHWNLGTATSERSVCGSSVSSKLRKLKNTRLPPIARIL